MCDEVERPRGGRSKRGGPRVKLELSEFIMGLGDMIMV